MHGDGTAFTGFGLDVDVSLRATSAWASHVPTLAVDVSPAAAFSAGVLASTTILTQSVGVVGTCDAQLLAPLHASLVDLSDVDRVSLAANGSAVVIRFTGLPAGVPLYVRAAGVSGGSGWPSTALVSAPTLWPVAITPAATPVAPRAAHLSPLHWNNASALAVLVHEPAFMTPRGSNGAALLGYQVEVAEHNTQSTATLLLLDVMLTAAAGVPASFVLAGTAAGGSAWQTPCISTDVDADALQASLSVWQHAYNVQVRPVHMTAALTRWQLSFDWEYAVAPVQAWTAVGCAGANVTSAVHVQVAQAGTSASTPEIVIMETTNTNTSAHMNGTFSLSWSFDGPFTRDVCALAGAASGCASVTAGSRIVSTSVDLRPHIARGVGIELGGHRYRVSSAANDEFSFRVLTLDAAAPASLVNAPARSAATLLGLFSIAFGSSSLNTHGVDLTSVLRVTDTLLITGQQYTVQAVVPSAVQLASAFAGTGVAYTPVYKRWEVSVAYDVSAADLASTLMSGWDSVGSVEVTRVGPTSDARFRWYMTFTSLQSASVCTAPAGAPTYFPTSPCVQVHATSRAVPSAPTLATADQGARAWVHSAGVPVDFGRARTTASEPSTREVQVLRVESGALDVSGSLVVGDTEATVAVPLWAPAVDVAFLLSSRLPTVGDVSVSAGSCSAERNVTFCRAWMVNFTSTWGDVPMLTVSSASLSASATV
ncbi:hypothetical protein EON62_02145, partial [archaeon]